MSQPKCGGCRFFEPQQHLDRPGRLTTGQCQRYPPALNAGLVALEIMSIQQDDPKQGWDEVWGQAGDACLQPRMFFFPAVNTEMKCGEFQPKRKS